MFKEDNSSLIMSNYPEKLALVLNYNDEKKYEESLELCG